MKEGQELVGKKETELSVFNEFEAELVEFEKVNELVTFDIETYEGETDCKKHIKQIGKLRIGVEKLRVKSGKGFLEAKRAVDDEAKVWQARIAAIDAVHSVPLKELENKRIAKSLAIQEAAKAKERQEEADRVAAIEAREQEANARIAKIEAKEAELKAVEDAANIEAEAKEREDQARKDAEANAEQAVRDAVVRAEAEKVAAVEAEREKARAIETERLANEESDRLERVRIADAERAEAEAAQRVESKRIANQDHRREFNNLAAEKLTLITKDLDMSIAIVTAIVKLEIDNVTLNY